MDLASHTHGPLDCDGERLLCNTSCFGKYRKAWWSWDRALALLPNYSPNPSQTLDCDVWRFFTRIPFVQLWNPPTPPYCLTKYPVAIWSLMTNDAVSPSVTSCIHYSRLLRGQGDVQSSAVNPPFVTGMSRSTLYQAHKSPDFLSGVVSNDSLSAWGSNS
ncbi:hypothetical protein RRG08_053228 [Elysia crispata]|uniref:Uncharacterized protein n=1 Tax=Elysia crispata TaxID=231223 RepID=A0AAE1E1J5_9GAST|nr:hypothetical protein RRG08_053228 [Elysia crispata]